MTNPREWPSIAHFPQRICYSVTQLIQDIELAARVLQHHWRRRRQKLPHQPLLTERHYWTRPSHIQRDLDAPAFATVKLDGTNFGVDDEGKLFGRRTQLDSIATSYQRVPIYFLRNNAGAVQSLQARIAEQGGEPRFNQLDLIVYGELMCNASLHDYVEKNFHQRWIVFGAIADAGQTFDEDQVQSIAAQLTAGGFACSVSGTKKIKLFLTPLMREAIVQARIGGDALVAEEMCRGTLVDVVAKAFDWMVQNRGEGLVVCHTTGAEQNQTLAKWKCSAEPQSKSQRVLVEVKNDLQRVPSFLLPVGLVETIDRLHAVAHAPVHVSKCATTKQKKAAARVSPQLQKDIDEAIDSALTKYDTLESFFAKGSKAVNEIRGLLAQEVCADIAELHPDNKTVAIKQATSATAKFVGQAFGRWKKQKR